MDIKGEFFQRFINILRKKISEGAVKMTVCQTINQLNNYTKPIIGKWKKQKIYSPFIDNVCRADIYAINKQIHYRNSFFVMCY